VGKVSSYGLIDQSNGSGISPAVLFCFYFPQLTSKFPICLKVPFGVTPACPKVPFGANKALRLRRKKQTSQCGDNQPTFNVSTHFIQTFFERAS